MEKSPSFESGDSSEKLAAEILKEKGPQSPEFQEWLTQEEAVVNEINTSRASVDLSIKLARVYYSAGFVDQAIESLNENREAAQGEGEDLLKEVDNLLDRMEAGVDI
jgi:hypothetical protein